MSLSYVLRSGSGVNTIWPLAEWRTLISGRSWKSFWSQIPMFASRQPVRASTSYSSQVHTQSYLESQIAEAKGSDIYLSLEQLHSHCCTLLVHRCRAQWSLSNCVARHDLGEMLYSEKMSISLERSFLPTPLPTLTNLNGAFGSWGFSITIVFSTAAFFSDSTTRSTLLKLIGWDPDLLTGTPRWEKVPVRDRDLSTPKVRRHVSHRFHSLKRMVVWCNEGSLDHGDDRRLHFCL